MKRRSVTAPSYYYVTVVSNNAMMIHVAEKYHNQSVLSNDILYSGIVSTMPHNELLVYKWILVAEHT